MAAREETESLDDLNVSLAAPPQNHLLGIMLSTAGFTAWAVSDAFIKMASETITASTVLAISVFCSAVCTFLLAAKNGGIGQLRTQRLRFHLVRAALCAVSYYFCVLALKNLPLTSFYMIVFLSPLLIALLEKVFLRETASLLIWLAILFGLGGIVVAVQSMPRDSDVLVATTSFGIIAAIINASTYSVIAVMTRHARTENNYALTIWPDTVILPVALGLMMWEGGFKFDATGMVMAIFSGVLGCLGFLLTNASLRMAPAAVVSPYHYTQIISGALLGYFIWGHLPSLGVLVGAVMIIAAGLAILQQTAAEKAAPAP